MNYLETRKRCAERPATDGFAAAVTTELMWKGGDARMRRRAVPIRNRLLRTARCCASGAFRESPARHRTVVRYRCVPNSARSSGRLGVLTAIRGPRPRRCDCYRDRQTIPPAIQVRRICWALRISRISQVCPSG